MSRSQGARERGASSVLVAVGVAAVTVMTVMVLLVAQVARARQSAATIADLGALAAVTARVSGREACVEAGRLVEVNGGRLVSCAPGDDDSVQVDVAVVWSPLVFAARSLTVSATARAGVVPDPTPTP